MKIEHAINRLPFSVDVGVRKHQRPSTQQKKTDRVSEAVVFHEFLVKAMEKHNSNRIT